MNIAGTKLRILLAFATSRRAHQVYVKGHFAPEGQAALIPIAPPILHPLVCLLKERETKVEKEKRKKKEKNKRQAKKKKKRKREANMAHEEEDLSRSGKGSENPDTKTATQVLRSAGKPYTFPLALAESHHGEDEDYPLVLAQCHQGEDGDNSGGEKYPIFSPTREISYRCFKRCQKYS